MVGATSENEQLFNNTVFTRQDVNLLMKQIGQTAETDEQEYINYATSVLGNPHQSFKVDEVYSILKDLWEMSNTNSDWGLCYMMAYDAMIHPQKTYVMILYFTSQA